MRILVTGAKGFIGRHLADALRRRPDCQTILYDVDSRPEVLEQGLAEADTVFHLAGINRPQHADEFRTGNVDFTAHLCSRLQELRRKPVVVFSSSIQAALDNPYGVSKRQAEETLRRFAECAGTSVILFRLKNVFGKWCRPNYNSVTATFCHNLAHDLPIQVSDPNRELELVYIDDVVAGFLRVLTEPTRAGGCEYREISPSFAITLGNLAARIQAFRQSRQTLVLPSFEEELTRCLYATYLSYLDGPDFAYPLDRKTDPRGSLAEFMKSAQFGQVFVSRTKPGIVRGNHYHHTKTEKFLVVEGQALIRFRHIERADLIEHRVSGQDFRVVDIPPGYTHSIENVGSGELVVLFWASEVFDPQRPDTIPEPVQKSPGP